MISACGYSAFRRVFGSNPVGLYGWDAQDEDFLTAQDASVSGQFAHPWNLRMMAQEAALEEVANSKLRRLPAYGETSTRTDEKIGDSDPFYKAPNRNVQSEGPARILNIDTTGTTARYRSQTFKVTRNCVINGWMGRRRVDRGDLWASEFLVAGIVPRRRNRHVSRCFWVQPLMLLGGRRLKNMRQH